ncbi:hypothetical protein V1477_017334 [Vespula maculifrons]|uniref:Uncharacterized protein n=1 Tax=Vespula maculifrons TaxID=7453 RepID=A0ABD2B615_VESMC
MSEGADATLMDFPLAATLYEVEPGKGNRICILEQIFNFITRLRCCENENNDARPNVVVLQGIKGVKEKVEEKEFHSHE